MQLIERLAGHLKQRVQGRICVVVFAGYLLLSGSSRGRRRRVRLGTTGYFRAGATLAAVRTGPAAGARRRLVIGRLWPVLLMVMMMVVLLLLLVLEVLDEQRVREKGADYRLSVCGRRWRRNERAAGRLVFLGPRTNDFRRVFGAGDGRGRRRFTARGRRLVAEYVGDAE